MRTALAAGLLAFALPAPVRAERPVAPELLQRLADSDARIQLLYAQGSFTLSTRLENRDGSGTKVQSTTEIVTRMFRKDGKPWEEIVRFVDGGKDETESHREKREKELERGKRNRADAIPWESPFGASAQTHYRFTDGGPADGGAHEVIHFETLAPAKERGSGDAVVDPEKGAVLSLHFSPSVLPRFVHTTVVDMHFDAATPVGPALSSFTVDGEGGVLFVKKRVHVEGSIEGYELDTPMTASDGTAAAAAAAGAAGSN